MVAGALCRAAANGDLHGPALGVLHPALVAFQHPANSLHLRKLRLRPEGFEPPTYGLEGR